jgi:hypothetical protein
VPGVRLVEKLTINFKFLGELRLLLCCHQSEVKVKSARGLIHLGNNYFLSTTGYLMGTVLSTGDITLTKVPVPMKFIYKQ